MEFIAFVVVVLLLMAVTAETVANRLNPTPRMSNKDRRFIFMDNRKTRDLFECIKR